MSASDALIVKLMALTEADFLKSLAALDPLAGKSGPERPATIPIPGGGFARIAFAAAPPVTLGRLLALPRATVMISFEDADEHARAAFLRRFDIAFQRGGG